uniref:hypothetical protein n=1 Tax=Mycolicibacterium obuense TaxID=1807 RepID=UPI003F589118
MMVMTDSVAMGGAMVYPIAAFLVALAAIGLLSLLFVVLLALVVRRLCRRTDRFGATRWSDSSVNTVGGGFPRWVDLHCGRPRWSIRFLSQSGPSDPGRASAVEASAVSSVHAVHRPCSMANGDGNDPYQ